MASMPVFLLGWCGNPPERHRLFFFEKINC
jgi:hypothetical protein